MKNLDRVYEFILQAHPRRVTNGEIAKETGINPHQQVFQLTQRLLQLERIRGIQYGKEWQFWVEQEPQSESQASPTTGGTETAAAEDGSVKAMSAADFEAFAVEAMSTHFGVALTKGSVSDVPKVFDLVSEDQSIVGDAKYFTLVGGERLPPAKFSVIAEYVWLLEHTEADHKFLVFGNDRRVPEEWLRRFGHLVSQVEFFFLDDDGTLQVLRCPPLQQEPWWKKLLGLVRQKP